MSEGCYLVQVSLYVEQKHQGLHHGSDHSRQYAKLVLHVSTCIEGTARQNARLTLIGVQMKFLCAGCISRRDAHYETAANFPLFLFSIFVRVSLNLIVS